MEIVESQDTGFKQTRFYCHLASTCQQLTYPGTLVNDRPGSAVTFVENHDIVRTDGINNDKILAYSVILTHKGYPCVFWQDYFN